MSQATVDEFEELLDSDPPQCSEPERVVPSAGRGVMARIATIIDVFDCEEQVLSLSNLTRRANLPKPTVHRLAEQLCAVGWLERQCDGYRIGIRLFELGGLALQRNRLRDTAYPHMFSLARQTGLSVQLGVLDGGEVVYVERVLTGGYRLPTRLGGREPAYCTAIGKAMLAFDDKATQAVMASKLTKRTQHTISDPDVLGDALARTCAAGVAFDWEEAYRGLVCIAAPIRNSGRAIGAISVTAPRTRMDADAVVKGVQRAALAIWSDRFATR